MCLVEGRVVSSKADVAISFNVGTQSQDGRAGVTFLLQSHAILMSTASL